jgi:hypothetical protein
MDALQDMAVMHCYRQYAVSAAMQHNAHNKLMHQPVKAGHAAVLSADCTLLTAVTNECGPGPAHSKDFHA